MKTRIKHLQNLILLIFRALCLALCLALCITSCASAPIDENDPAALMKEVEAEIASDHFLMALDKLKVIKNKFPYSKQATEAHLRIADVYYLQENFLEAASTYESFQDLHPKHEKAAYAMLKRAQSYYQDIPGTVARDLTSAQKALDALNEFTRRFPNHESSADARALIAKIRNLLASKELMIGDFYFNQDIYGAAKPRYKKIIEQFPETQAATKAQENLSWIESHAK